MLAAEPITLHNTLPGGHIQQNFKLSDDAESVEFNIGDKPLQINIDNEFPPLDDHIVIDDDGEYDSEEHLLLQLTPLVGM